VEGIRKSMSDYQVPSGSTAKLDRVDGELRIGKKARLESPSGKIVVTGRVYFEGDADVNCDLECDSLETSRRLPPFFGPVRVNGNLVVHKNLNVTSSIDAKGEIRAEEIDGGGRIVAGSIICKNIRITGIIEVKNKLEVEESIDIGGKLIAPTTVKLRDLDVNGMADIGGGSISGHTKIKGKLDCKSRLEFGDIQVFGKASLSGNCSGSSASTFGALSVNGNFKCDEIRVDGKTDVRGNCESSKIEVNGKLDVSGSLSIADKMEIHGSTEVTNDIKGSNIQVAGKLKANSIIISDQALITGTVETKHGLKAKSIVIGSGSRCEGPLVGEQVEVGKSGMNVMAWGTKWVGQNINLKLTGRPTRVDDVYGTSVYLREFSTARKVFSQNVELEKASSVDQVVYSGEFKKPSGNSVYMNHPPEKVNKLPPPPI